MLAAIGETLELSTASEHEFRLGKATRLAWAVRQLDCQGQRFLNAAARNSSFLRTAAYQYSAEFFVLR